MKWAIIALLVMMKLDAFSQLYAEQGAELTLQKGSVLTVEGDIESASAFGGDGSLHFAGLQPQYLNMHGQSISNLLLDNAAGLFLSGDASVQQSLQLLNGNIFLEKNNLFIGSDAGITNNNGNFINTTGDGIVRKYISNNLVNYSLPLGTDGNYSPVLINTSGTYVNAFIDAGARSSDNPLLTSAATDYLTTWWTIRKNGINGSVSTAIQYSDNAVKGNVQQLAGFYSDGKKVTEIPSSINIKSRLLSADIKQDNTVLLAMNSALKKIALTPNPVRNVAYVSVYSARDAVGSMDVLDLLGRKIYTKTISLVRGSNQYLLPMYPLKNGTYTVQVSTADKKEMIKVIKL